MIRRSPKDKKPKEPFWQRITLRSFGKVAVGAVGLEVGLLCAAYIGWRLVHDFMKSLCPEIPKTMDTYLIWSTRAETLYYVSRRTNVDPQFRYDLYTGKYRGAGTYWLSAYYKMGELMDSSLEQREHDLAYWRAVGKDV